MARAKTKKQVQEVLKQKIEGQKISITGENPGGGDSIRYRIELTSRKRSIFSSSLMSDEAFTKFAQDNGFKDGMDLIDCAEKHRLVKGSYIH